MKTPGELLDLTGKVAVVTGGSRGIGRAVAEGFATAGADVVIASRKLDNCETAAEEIEAATGRRALPVGCHVGEWEDCDRLVDTVYDEFGRCDVLVNNAGMSPLYDDLPSVTRGALRQGPRRQRSRAVPAQRPDRHADGRGRRRVDHQRHDGRVRCAPTPTDLPYAMAKAGLNALTLGARRRVGAEGAGQPRAARRLRHRHHQGVGPGGQGPGRRDQPDEAHRAARGHGRRLRLPGQRRRRLHRTARVLVDGGLFRTL